MPGRQTGREAVRRVPYVRLARHRPHGRSARAGGSPPRRWSRWERTAAQTAHWARTGEVPAPKRAFFPQRDRSACRRPARGADGAAWGRAAPVARPAPFLWPSEGCCSPGSQRRHNRSTRRTADTATNSWRCSRLLRESTRHTPCSVRCPRRCTCHSCRSAMSKLSRHSLVPIAGDHARGVVRAPPRRARRRSLPTPTAAENSSSPVCPE